MDCCEIYINYSKFQEMDEHITFHLAQSSGQNFNSSNILVIIIVKPTFPLTLNCVYGWLANVSVPTVSAKIMKMASIILANISM